MPRKPRQLRKPRPPGPAAFVRRKQWLRRGLGIGLAILLALLVLLDRQGWLLVPRDDMAAYHHQTFRVVRVIDGDTLDIAAPDGGEPTTRVRLWGIDTPERARPDVGIAAEPWAAEATQLARQLADDRTVTLVLEPHRTRGGYGRLLAYVQLPDGAVLNEQMLLAGLAVADDRWPHRHDDRYRLLQLQAQRERVGRWSGDAPAGR